ncbi:MAG: YabP/YqfC family sporulation protein [Firmicutes bacterium]|nr:YabP/YqfC family sporulation protein [Bacillota bacterium]
MLGFWSEITGAVRLPSEIDVKGFKFINLGNRALFVHGKTKVFSYSAVKIVLSAGRTKLYVYGKNLIISHLSGTDISITGEILCVAQREVAFD